jgi:hypothetical protein
LALVVALTIQKQIHHTQTKLSATLINSLPSPTFGSTCPRYYWLEVAFVEVYYFLLYYYAVHLPNNIILALKLICRCGRGDLASRAADCD